MNKRKKFLLPAAGAAIGFINGFFGGGGGMLAVPALSALVLNDEKKAHATAAAVVLPLSVVSGAVYLFKGAADLPVLLSAGGGVVLGGIAGALMLKKLSNEKLATVFYILTIASGIYNCIR
ncbi:MAG: sulfite exporter TauE/SafE family protein [Clostridiales bacterium]|jgi:uncharacterized membrane protein YfcA|nr:sulfite exporter TauE/SafE family protein [Clostridiales bacterium]